MFIFIMVLSALIIIISFFKSRHFFASLFLSALHGLIALFAVNFIGGFISIYLNVNLFSILVSSLGGLPGVIYLVISDFLM